MLLQLVLSEFFFFSFLLCISISYVEFRVSIVCRKWKQGVQQSLARRVSLSFAGWKMDDDSTARLVRHAYSLKELDMYSFLSLLLLWQPYMLNYVTVFIYYIYYFLIF